MIDATDRLRLLFENGRERREPRVAIKSPLTGEHLVEQGAERENIAARIHLIAFGLLRRHVRSGPDNRAPLGVWAWRFHTRRLGKFARRGLGNLCQPEIQHFDEIVLGHHNVGRLQISVNNSRRVSLRQRFGDLHGILQRLVQPQPVPADQLIQRFARHVLHRDERLPVLLANVIDRADVRMVQGRCSLGLTLKAGQRLGVSRNFRREELQCDEAMQPRVLGLVHYPHATATELLDDAVVRDGSADHWRESYGCETCKSMKAVELAVFQKDCCRKTITLIAPFMR